MSDKLLKCIEQLKQKGLSKKVVNTVLDKAKRYVNSHPNFRELDIHTLEDTYGLLDGTEEAKLMERWLGRCDDDACDNVRFRYYQGPSGKEYCGFDCASAAEDIWEVCAHCGGKFDYYMSDSSVIIEDTQFCSEDCFWYDLIKMATDPGGWYDVYEFFREHPQCDPSRMMELRGNVSPWDITDHTDEYLEKLYEEELESE